jgi:hypothetical protein
MMWLVLSMIVVAGFALLKVRRRRKTKAENRYSEAA